MSEGLGTISESGLKAGQKVVKKYCTDLSERCLADLALSFGLIFVAC